MVGSKISVEVTDADGNTAVSEETAKVRADLSNEVTIIDRYGFQSDGTAVVGDRLQVSYGSDFGVPKSITWYLNDVVAQAVNSNQGGINLNYYPAKEGEVYAVIMAEDGETYISENTVTVVEDELAPVIESFEIVDDYEGGNLSVAKNDGLAIIDMTVSKAYDGTYYLFKDGVKIVDDNILTGSAWAATANTVEVTKTNFTTKYLMEKATLTDGTSAAYDGIYYLEDDGTAHYMWLSAAAPVRGTSYVIAFDQSELSSDDIGTTENADVNVVDEAAEAPYLIAPDGLELAIPTAGSGDYKLTIVDEDGDAYKGLSELTVNSFGTTVLYTKASADATTSSSVGTSTALWDDGVNKPTGLTKAAKGKYYFAEVTLKKGIFGADSIKLTSDDVVCGQPGSGAITLTKNSTTATTADIAFKTKTLDNGVVYITKDKDKFNAADSGTYTASVEVKADATEAKVEDAFDEAGSYWAVFVPEDDKAYSNVTSDELKYSTAIETISFATESGVTGAAEKVTLSNKIVALDAWGQTVSPSAKTTTDGATGTLFVVDDLAYTGSGNTTGTAAASHTGAPVFTVAADGSVGFQVAGAAVKYETYATTLDKGALVAVCTTAGSANTSVWDISYVESGLPIWNTAVDGTTYNGTAMAQLKKSGWTVEGLAGGAMVDIADGATFKVAATGKTFTGAFENKGTISQANGIAASEFSGALTNSGTINSDAGTSMTLSAAFVNKGTVNVTNGTLITSAGATNSGTINIGSGTTYQVTTTALTNSGTISNKGTLDIDIASSSSGTINGADGTIDYGTVGFTVSDGTNKLGTIAGTTTGLALTGGTNTIKQLGSDTATILNVTGGNTTVTTVNTTGAITLNAASGSLTLGTVTKATGTNTITAGTLVSGSAGLNGTVWNTAAGSTVDVSAVVTAGTGTITMAGNTELIVASKDDLTATATGNINLTITKGKAFILTVVDSKGAPVGTVDATAATTDGSVKNAYTAAVGDTSAYNTWTCANATA